jgi:hypothetical protein
VAAVLHFVDRLLEIAQEDLAEAPEPRSMAPATMLAITIAGTPGAGAPAVDL